MSTYPKTALVINCGSSSVKFAILDPKDGHVFLNGIAEALGLADARISWKFNGGEKTETQLGAGADHSKALEFLVKNVLAKDEALHDSIVACGHRIVQGGDIYSQPTLIDDEVEENIKKVIPFAPLHNPAHLLGIDAARANFPSIPHVAVFDTAFHQTMPPKAYRYAIPEEYYTDLHLRKYGAHGTSHRYVAGRAAEMLGKPLKDLKLITMHIGAGASITAIKDGKSFDTSMGFSPLAGITMATRSGDVDPSLVAFVQEKLGVSSQEMISILNHKSGLLGISQLSPDMRDILAAADKGNDQAQLALDMYVNRIVRYVGAYIAEMDGADAIVFTAGVGENSIPVRKMVTDKLAYFGIKIDQEKNKCHGVERDLSADDAKIKTLLIPTNEELMIVRDIERLKKEQGK